MNPLVRFQLDDAVSKAPGALVSGSSGIYDAARRSESPQEGLRLAKPGVELGRACDDAINTVSSAYIRSGDTMYGFASATFAAAFASHHKRHQNDKEIRRERAALCDASTLLMVSRCKSSIAY